ncbi:unnamed protein product, partial [Mesorhabditis spiculigera]
MFCPCSHEELKAFLMAIHPPQLRINEQNIGPILMAGCRMESPALLRKCAHILLQPQIQLSVFVRLSLLDRCFLHEMIPACLSMVQTARALDPDDAAEHVRLSIHPSACGHDGSTIGVAGQTGHAATSMLPMQSPQHLFWGNVDVPTVQNVLFGREFITEYGGEQWNCRCFLPCKALGPRILQLGSRMCPAFDSNNQFMLCLVRNPETSGFKLQ